MLKRYRNFLTEFNKKLSKYFDEHKDFICCKEGCSECCEIGEYPFSRLEAEYIMSGFITLSADLQNRIKSNIKEIAQKYENSKMYQCPFLIDCKCALYEYRGIICRTFGLAYVKNGVVKLPECANSGLNYNKIYDKNKNEIILENPIMEDLGTYNVLHSKLAEKYELECGEIRPLIKWFL